MALPPVVRVPRQGSLPLSFAQQRMWFLHQLDPLSSAYNLAQAVRLRGNLDVEALKRCFGELARRHEALRTVFRVADGQPVQVVLEPTPLSLPIVDLSAVPASAGDAESRRLVAAHRPLGFALSQGPLLRTALLRFAAEGHALLLAIHHIVADGWSFGVLVRDLVALYRAFAAGVPSPPPELVGRDAEFARLESP